MGIKVSIIVPVYNQNKYLKKCVESLINQTMKEIEIILIDDASTDNSAEIMKNYQENYPNLIRCIYLEENLHQGGARNRGLEIATGEYILFVDSDDWLDVTCCEKLYGVAMKKNCDIVHTNIMRYYQETGETSGLINFSDKLTGTLQGIKRSCALNCYIDYPCARLIKREYWDTHEIKFPEHVFFEDTRIMSTILWMENSQHGFVEETLYYYRINQTGVTVSSLHSPYPYMDGLMEAWNIYSEKYKSYNFYYMLNIINRMLGSINSMIAFDCVNNEEKTIFIKYCFQKIKETYSKEVMNNFLEDLEKNGGLYPLEYRCLKLLLEKNLEDLIHLFDNNDVLKEISSGIKYNGKHEFEKFCQQHNVAIWGASLRANLVACTLDKEQQLIKVFIDKKPKSQYSLSGHGIIKPEELEKYDIDSVLVANEQWFLDIREEVEGISEKSGRNITVHSMDMLIRFGII